MRNRDSFTLIELLVVIAVLAVLGTAVVLVINPAELVKQGHDATRLSDLSALNNMLGALKSDNIDATLGSANTVSVSVPDSSPTCANLGLQPLPSGWSYHCAPTSTLLNVDGTGWAPIDFTQFSAGAALSRLPIDPINTISSRDYYAYTTANGFWELSASVEASKNKAGGSADKVSTDQGQYYNLLETGTNLSLLPVDYSDASLVAYWPFDESSGTTSTDASGNRNTVTLFNTPPHAPSCKKNGCILFNDSGATNYALVNTTSSLNPTQAVSVSAWIYITTTTPTGEQGIVDRSGGGYVLNLINSNLECRVNIGGFKTVPPNATLAQNTWYFVGCTYDGATIKSYLNGSVDNQIAQTGAISVSGLAIGIARHPAGSSQYFGGYIDEIHIRNRALSPGEMQALYNATK